MWSAEIVIYNFSPPLSVSISLISPTQSLKYQSWFFAKDFANALAEFDEIRLLDIYAARELPIEGVTSITLLKTIQSKYKSFINKDEIREEIDNTKCEVIMMLGAGDISIEIEKLKK